jgi:Helix-turn-helix domain
VVSRPKSTSLTNAVVVSLPEGGQMLRVGPATMQKRVNSGVLDSVKIGRSRRISVESIMRVAQDGTPPAGNPRFKRKS